MSDSAPTQTNQLPGPILLRFPAEPSLSRVLRLAAAGLASLGNFTVDHIEDIKIAVSEVLIALIEHGSGGPVDVSLGYDAEAFRISGTTDVKKFSLDNQDLALCRTILEEVCSTHSVDVLADLAVITATVGRNSNNE